MTMHRIQLVKIAAGNQIAYHPRYDHCSSGSGSSRISEPATTITTTDIIPAINTERPNQAGDQRVFGEIASWRQGRFESLVSRPS